MGYRWIWKGLFLASAVAVLSPVDLARAGQPEKETAAKAVEEVAFPLQEISILKTTLDPALQSDLTRGARAECQEGPHEAVKAYPKLLSKKPVYGLIRLAADPYQKESGTPLYFVADESGEKPPEEEPAKEEPKKEASILDTLGAALGIKKANRPADEQLPKLSNTYDRLYIDLSGDLDLTNDPVVVPMKKPPASLIYRYSSLRQQVVFEEISVPLEFGEDLGRCPVRLVPRLEVQEYQGKEYPGVGFISAVARTGGIKLGDRSYQAVLAQRYLITGRYDRPFTGLLLTASDNPNGKGDWWGADQLSAMRLAGDTYYTTTSTPLGDQLIVKPYQGPMGILKIGPGDRKLEKLTIQGGLNSEDTSLAVGKLADSGRREPVSECRLPVGDYIPNYVTIEYGDLRIGISENYHSDGKPMSVDRDSWIHGIQIREDKPFVWDFSTPPDVMFASPAKDQTYRPDDEISVKAVLIDPKLTVMIRRLNDTSRMEDKEIETGDGRKSTYKTQVSLDPIVTITNASGKQIAEGPMPFG